MPSYNVKITSPTAGTYKVVVNGIDLKNQGNGAVIQWKIDPQSDPNWVFASPAGQATQGIEIKNPGNAFGSGNGGPNVCTWTRNSADDTLYDYTLAVTNGTTTLIIDPSIINR